MHRRNSGYIIEQLLISLLIIAFFIPVIMCNLHIISTLLDTNPKIQDEVTIAQMRHILNCAMNVEISSTAISFLYHNEQSQFYYDQNRVLLKPGTQFFLTEIDQCQFYEQNGVIYITYERKQKKTTKAIGHK